TTEGCRKSAPFRSIYADPLALNNRQIHPSRIIVDNRQYRRTGCAQRGAIDRVAERKVDRLVGLVKRIVEDQHRECLARLAVGEEERPTAGGEVIVDDSRAIADRKVDRERPCAAGRAADRDGRAATIFADREGWGAKLHPTHWRQRNATNNQP